ncbi:RNA helicase (nucleomorph) [Bigelowiella natans]|uniref:RNA helicase n=1 Tax=Bigelowiella natans TaxID=227086 RepID=Q3LVW2_BIGNA|nr:RNA helicase [Bigelowiella natans]ABA27403.1 RNA helicase [Bigelowiella natans]|mmetsp:Transcript_17366/g.24144  ORF Transcript_17366/g.24144 Transcript_17366/m.24144 type:complete len:331 (+) Transcript_17366:1262-2254(+)
MVINSITYDSLTNTIIRNLKRKTPSKCKSTWNIKRVVKFYQKKINIFTILISNYLKNFSRKIPDLLELNNLELDLIHLMIDKNKLFTALKIVQNFNQKIELLKKDFYSIVSCSTSQYRARSIKKAYLGIVLNKLKQNIVILQYLSKAFVAVQTLLDLRITSNLQVIFLPKTRKYMFLDNLFSNEIIRSKFYFKQKLLKNLFHYNLKGKIITCYFTDFNNFNHKNKMLSDILIMIFAIHLKSNLTFFININTEMKMLVDNLYRIEKLRKFYYRLKLIFVITGFRQCSFKTLDKKIFVIHKFLQKRHFIDSQQDTSQTTIKELFKYYFVFNK